MSGWWRGLRPGAQRLVQGAGFLAAVVFLVVFVDSAVPAENRLTPTLTTDREVYFVGETIRVEASYVNSYSYPVSFSPPSTLPGISGVYEGEVSSASSIVNFNWVARSFLVEPGASFTVLRSEFAAAREGDFVVGWMSLSRTVQVLPPEPYVARGDLIARIVTDKTVYHLNENGNATIEYYNPGPGQVSFAPPTPVTMGFELDGVKLDRVVAAHISWMISRFELAPGETVTIITLHFRTPEAGRLTLTALGASETVLVLPTE